MISAEQLAQSILELKLSQQKTDEQMKKTDEQMKRTDEKLKSMGISNIYCSDEKMALRLKFYGILSGDSYSLSLYPKENSYKKVTISYIKIPLKTYYVSKINR